MDSSEQPFHLEKQFGSLGNRAFTGSQQAGAV
jgi:hypothetical protein